MRLEWTKGGQNQINSVPWWREQWRQRWEGLVCPGEDEESQSQSPAFHMKGRWLHPTSNPYPLPCWAKGLSCTGTLRCDLKELLLLVGLQLWKHEFISRHYSSTSLYRRSWIIEVNLTLQTNGSIHVTFVLSCWCAALLNVLYIMCSQCNIVYWVSVDCETFIFLFMVKVSS